MFGLPVIKKSTTHLLFWLLIAHAGLLITSASAGVVSRGSPGSHDNSWSKFDVALDLSGYRNAAVAFSFAALISRSPKRFRLISAPRMSYLDGFRLLARVRPPNASTDLGPSTRGNRGRFKYRGGRHTYSIAMFNLAAYDGQSVILSVAVNKRAANRRHGVVNLENLKLSVAAAGTAELGTSIPEPTSATLLGVGLIGLVSAKRCRRRKFPYVENRLARWSNRKFQACWRVY